MVAVRQISNRLSRPIRRSSITRLSVDDKALRTKEVSSQEQRDLMLNKSTLVAETIPEKASESDKESNSESETGMLFANLSEQQEVVSVTLN